MKSDVHHTVLREAEGERQTYTCIVCVCVFLCMYANLHACVFLCACG